MKSKILAEDQHILVCFKPPGLAVQSGRIGEPDMVSELKNYLGGRNPYLGLVHRLDQPVSGILVFAKTPQAAAKLSQQAAAHGEAPQGGKNQTGKQKRTEIKSREKKQYLLWKRGTWPLFIPERKEMEQLQSRYIRYKNQYRNRVWMRNGMRYGGKK